MALVTVKQNHEQKDSRMIPNISFQTKYDSKEKIWIAFESILYPMVENQFTIYYGISFEDRSEQQLCKIFLSVTYLQHCRNSWTLASTFITLTASWSLNPSFLNPWLSVSLKKKLENISSQMASQA